MKKKAILILLVLVALYVFISPTFLTTLDSAAKENVTEPFSMEQRIESDTPYFVNNSVEKYQESAILGFQISDVSYSGFQISCTTTSSVDKVVFSTWTSYNEKDDMMNYDGISSNNIFSYYIETKDHNYECGDYLTDIYAYDYSGNEIGFASTQIYIHRPIPYVYDIKISDQTTLGYTVTCKISDVNAVNRIVFPTWTDLNGQDDLIKDWRINPKTTGTIQDNTVTFRVDDKDHNYEKGLYYTDIYVYDNTERYRSTRKIVDVQNDFVPANTATYQKNEYLLFNDNLTWDEAKAKCEELGGHLLTINSQEEQDVVNELITGQARNIYYIGGILEGNTYRWITDEPFIYQNWNKGEPNNSGGKENSINVHTSPDLLGKWNDTIKAREIKVDGFICEIKAVPATGITLDESMLTLKRGQIEKLNATITPENATNKKITWKSANESAAFVDNFGHVIALSPGYTIIVAISDSGQHMAYCTVLVTDAMVNMSSMTELSMINELLTLEDVKEIIDNNNYPDWLDAIMNK